MYEVYEVTPAGRLGTLFLRTDCEGEALNHLNHLRGLGVPYLYAANGHIHHERGPEFGTIYFGESE